ncbi:MAG: M20/M25/M40 family metallo-hydrolase [Gemmatimonadaceae bacterium]|nr:M20/M25/M40 family metallo-hydrolase [Gemmatimonadaceae bacterium]
MSVAELAVRLMTIDSTSGREHEAMDEVDRLLSERNWRTRRIEVTPDGRSCVLATSADDIDVTLTTHLDTVPPFIPPRLDGDILWGRGACDAKGIAASMIMAAERLRARGIRAALLFVIGEETCHDGAHAANAWAAAHLAPRDRIFINGEPTDNTLGIGTKGAQRVVVRTRGKAAHSAYPAMGRSATHDLVRLLAELDGIAWPVDPVLGETTVNIGSLAGGVADNVFAPSAEARLMFRLVTPAQTIHEQVERWVNGRAELEWGVMVPPVRLGTLPGFATSVPAFATDVPALGNWGTPYLLGPGSVHVAHTDQEHVLVAELERAVDAYEQLALRATKA